MTTSSSHFGKHDIDARIYVACLAAYNNGILHGAWIDAAQDADSLRADVAAMLAKSPIPHAEEYAIHDYEGFEGIRIEEYTGIDRISEIAEFLSEHGNLGAAVASYFGDDLEDARRALDDRYNGCFHSLADFAQDITEQTMTIPDNLIFYIDWQKMARDMEMSGDVVTIETAHDEVHVFWAR
jgi:antirestriction protein